MGRVRDRVELIVEASLSNQWRIGCRPVSNCAGPLRSSVPDEASAAELAAQPLLANEWRARFAKAKSSD
jgi:hypothetical protein